MKLSKVLFISISSLILLLHTACLDDDTNSFSLVKKGYMLQNGDGANKSYTPYYFFSSTTVENKLSSVTITNSDKSENKLTLSKLNDYMFATDSTLKLSSPAEINGTYYVIAKSESGNTAQETITLEYADTDTISPLVLDEFSYNGTRIAFTLEKVPEAYCVGLVLTAYDEGNSPMRYANVFYNLAIEPSWTDNKLSLSVNFNSESGLDADYVCARVYVCNVNAVYRESEMKTIKKSGNRFLED